MLIEMRTATITGKGQITIPKEIRKTKGFSEGSKITILAFEDRVELRSLGEVSEKLLTALASEKALSKDWNSKEDNKTWKNL
ncbi:AbrB/MazE/SpoVT family DNA-binding domain-containing protein [Candidatus Woesearchaeota archaeon]|nr:AbrB/MazE/SpoVT family DNA-binding domain-containing protein [Candidatus Woesearchaeota archaeon]